MSLLQDIAGQLGWSGADGPGPGIWDSGPNAKPAGYQCLWSCFWNVGTTGNNQAWVISPEDLMPISSMDATQALVELDDVMNRSPGPLSKADLDQAALWHAAIEADSAAFQRATRRFLKRIRLAYPEFDSTWQEPTESQYPQARLAGLGRVIDSTRAAMRRPNWTYV
jgi:hypothetical protein